MAASQPAPAKTGLDILEEFARLQSFIDETSSLPHATMVTGEVELLGKTKSFSSVSATRWADVMRVMAPTAVTVGTEGALTPLSLSDLKALKSRPKFAWAEPGLRFRAVLWLFREEGIKMPSEQEYKAWSTSHNDLAQDVSNIDRAIRTSWAKWFDPVTRLRQPGFDKAAVEWRDKIRHCQDKMKAARVAHTERVEEYQAILAARDTELSALDPNWNRTC